MNNNPDNICLDQLFQEVMMFFTSDRFELIYPILVGEDVLSMSTINYFVINYAKEYSPYVLVDNKPTYVYRAYKEKLSRHRKYYFDPFCRQVKFPFYYNKDKPPVVTTLGQLNFYKWAIEIKLLDYIRLHYDTIIAEMKKYHKKEIDNTDSETTTSDKYKNKVLIMKSINLDFIDEMM